MKASLNVWCHSIITQPYSVWVWLEVLLQSIMKNKGWVGFISLKELCNTYIFKTLHVFNSFNSVAWRSGCRMVSLCTFNLGHVSFDTLKVH